MYQIIVSCIFLLLSSSLFGKMIDRTLLEAGSKTYSQRNFEVYNFAMVSLFIKPGSSPSELISETNWKSQLEIYKDEMLLNTLFDQDSQRLVSLIPNSDMLNASWSLVTANIRKTDWLSRYKSQKKFTESEIRDQLTIVLKVQAYLRSKDRKRQKKGWRVAVDSDENWFKHLKNTIAYRFFEGAHEYRSLKSHVLH